MALQKNVNNTTDSKNNSNLQFGKKARTYHINQEEAVNMFWLHYNKFKELENSVTTGKIKNGKIDRERQSVAYICKNDKPKRRNI